MRGGLERWKRGVDSHGVGAAIAYALQGRCDGALRASSGVEALAAYSDSGDPTARRFTVDHGVVTADELAREQLSAWVDGRDPLTGERRGREMTSPDADLILDGTINAPKSYSIVALLHPELAGEFEALQDRLRDRILRLWQGELNARRGAGGTIRENLARIEVVELQHRRSRALDPHIHRHLWLNVKVLGDDGKWSNIDSRVAMRMHTLVNAEGELAARTDPHWLAALARCGYTRNSDGEVAEIAHAVRPLSRRSTQIEANRAMLLTRWREEHPGQEAGRDVLQQIDRRSWAIGRPEKPRGLDESEWEQLVLDEFAEIDPALARPRAAIEVRTSTVASLDLELLAARAIVDADARSASTGGRFSAFDIRAGATRAVATSGVVASRETLQLVIDDVVRKAAEHTVDLLDGEENRPDHIKGQMAASTARLKIELAARFDALNLAGVALPDHEVGGVAASVLAPKVELDAGQRQAAGAIAGTDRLVAVTGPAGTGKTTMLRVARRALTLQHRRMVVVAPTKKAASVAAREVGAAASSLHALLADYGWRWARDAAGAEVWTRLSPGEIDTQTGMIYRGLSRYPVQSGDRIVVDEAGMIDLHTATALAALAEETGAGIAMVGDHLQAMPVGHSGAMACMARRSGSVVELTCVHRFHDPAYAALTLRLREPSSRDEAEAVARELAERSLIHRVGDAFEAREAMVAAYFTWAAERKRVALVTSTNDEADAINEAIQDRRLELGQLSLRRIAVGQAEQRILEGDVVQTRLNDRHAGVENRALWTVAHIHGDTAELVSLTDSADVRQVSLGYVAEHVHLAYASTVHGIQGETTDAAIVGPGVNASGLYVGMTRGRQHNEAIAIARTDSAAREGIAASMLRGKPEVTIDDSRAAARIELARAARSVDTVPTARWDNHATRPFGAEVDIERRSSDLARRLSQMSEEACRVEEWLSLASQLGSDVIAAEARSDAVAHGRGVGDRGEPDVDLRHLSIRMAAQSDDLTGMLRSMSAMEEDLEQLALERMLRTRMPADVAMEEERARALSSSRPALAPQATHGLQR